MFSLGRSDSMQAGKEKANEEQINQTMDVKW
jgi:hypothetical protein